MTLKYFRTLVIVGLLGMVGIFTLPDAAFAGACVCNGVEGFEPQRRVVDRCVAAGTSWSQNIKIESKADCEKVATNAKLGFAEVTCAYVPSNDCKGTIQCGNTQCTLIDESCSSNSECNKFKISNEPVYAAECKAGKCYVDFQSYRRYQETPKLLGVTADLKLTKPLFEIRIPGLKFTDVGDAIDEEGYLHIPYLAEFLSLVYKLAMGLGSIIAVIMVIAQGFKIVISEGGDLKSEAYHRITQIVIGLIILWGSYAILYTINPELVNFKVLKVKYIEPIEIPERYNESRPGGISAPGGTGPVAQADATQCPALTPGTEFDAAFTTYYNISHALYGQAGEYKGSYHGSDPSLQGMGDFFCAVSMECGCPSKADGGNGYGAKSCGQKNWPVCNYFSKNAKWCETKDYIPGGSVAASSCFPRNCKLESGGRTLIVKDRGAGIIGTHFDLYLGAKGDPNFVNDTKWLSTKVKVVDCPGTVSEQEKARLQKKYSGYKPGVCKPGVNC